MPAKVTYYANNRCGACGVLDTPQAVGRYVKQGGRWLQYRTCEACKQTYAYDVTSLYGAQLDAMKRKPKYDQAALIPGTGS